MENSEREQRIAHLTEVIGLPRENIELRLRDDDLWVLEPEGRFDAEIEASPEGAVRQWQDAAAFVDKLQYLYECRLVNFALEQLLFDLSTRANIALNRALERAEAAAGEAG